MPSAVLELPLPTPPFPAGSRPRLVPGFLSPEECRALIARAEAQGFRSASPDYPPSYRNNDRLVLDEPRLAAALLERLRPHLPAGRELTGEPRPAWRVSGLNERLRLCRYGPGQRFGIHRDGVHHRGTRERSLLTFMVYLNDAAEFSGGSTRFFPERGAPPSDLTVSPTAGTLILFRHDLWHDGEEVGRGVKYVLRSDILYRDESETEEAAEPRGYLWNVIEVGEGRLAAGSRDPGVWLWTVDGGVAHPSGRLDGHSHSVTALLAAAPDVLWTGSRDRTVRVWDLGNGRGECRRVLHGHQGAVLALARTTAGLVASGSADGTLRCWTTAGEPRGAREAGGGWVWALAGLDGSRIVCGTEDGALRVWDLASLEPAGGVGRVPSPVRALSFLPGTGGRLASGHADGIIRIWNRVADRRGAWVLAKELAGHRADVRALAPLPDGRLASGSEDGTLRLWTLGEDGVVLGRHSDFVTGLCLLADGRLASASYDGTLRVWDPAPAASRVDSVCKRRSETAEI